MSTLTIEKKNALTAYKEADDKGKTLLSNLFGKEVFSQKITDRIKTWEDVCAEADVDPDSDDFTEGEEDEIAYRKLKLIAKVLNEGWRLNWNNNSQYKWYPWFYMNRPGFRFGGSDSYYSVASTAGGSRLCFSSRELSDYAANTFLKIYTQLMTNGEEN